MSNVRSIHPYQLIGQLEVFADKLIARGHYMRDDVLLQWGQRLKELHDQMFKAQGEQARQKLERDLELSLQLIHKPNAGQHPESS